MEEEFPLETLTELQNHADEVWYLEFSHDGSMLATAGKDGLVCVYNTQTWRLQAEFREHDRNIAGSENNRGVNYVAFSPDAQHLISCSGNNEFVVVNVREARRVAMADHFDYPVTAAAWLPDSQTFVVGTQSYRRPLGLYSLRSSAGSSSSSSSVVRNNEIHSFRDPPWDPSLKDNPQSFRITDCAVSSDGTRLVATTTSNRIMMYDLNTRLKIAEWAMEDKLTSINFGVPLAPSTISDHEDDPFADVPPDTQLLVNMNSGHVLALSATTGEVLQRYAGARQAEYVIRSRFGGAGQNFVISGSEDSRVWIWRRQTGARVAVLEAHAPGTVNAVAWHPTDGAVWASAGDDRRVRM